MQRQQTSAVNEVIASILIVALVIALAVIIGGIVFGLIVIQPKSAYIPPEVKVVSYTNGTPQAISLYSRGGDTAYLDKGDNVQYALGVYVDRSEGSFRAKVEDDAGTFNPGQTLYLYYSTSGYRITDDLTGKQVLPLPAGSMTLRIVDENAKLLVYKEGMGIGGTGTFIPTTPATTSPTTTTTTVTTTTTTTITTPPTPACGTITGTKYNDLNGNGRKDNNEPGLSNWVINAYYRDGPNWVFVKTATTGSDGSYTLTGLRYFQSAEQYRIYEVQQTNWIKTEPGGDYHEIKLNPNICYAAGINFGNKQNP